MAPGGARQCIVAVALSTLPIADAGRGDCRCARTPRLERSGQVRAGGGLAHLLERLAGAAPLAERDAARGSDLLRAVAPAEAGATGVEGFDDWVRELVQYGYLHTRERVTALKPPPNNQLIL
jgi:hypothetical protein